MNHECKFCALAVEFYPLPEPTERVSVMNAFIVVAHTVITIPKVKVMKVERRDRFYGVNEETLDRNTPRVSVDSRELRVNCETHHLTACLPSSVPAGAVLPVSYARSLKKTSSRQHEIHLVHWGTALANQGRFPGRSASHDHHCNREIGDLRAACPVGNKQNMNVTAHIGARRRIAVRFKEPAPSPRRIRDPAGPHHPKGPRRQSPGSLA